MIFNREKKTRLRRERRGRAYDGEEKTLCRCFSTPHSFTLEFFSIFPFSRTHIHACIYDHTNGNQRRRERRGRAYDGEGKIPFVGAPPITSPFRSFDGNFFSFSIKMFEWASKIEEKCSTQSRMYASFSVHENVTLLINLLFHEDHFCIIKTKTKTKNIYSFSIQSLCNKSECGCNLLV